ncbi:MAG TPA: SDR family oxidoreductase [Pirellulales bacterium]|jgi:hypothetical protein|nr:SDR family oxidoreductase [Pirellulales bacterium]
MNSPSSVAVAAAARPTALVTGASSGIGREFARVLARRGYDLIISARRVERLQDLKRELEEAHSIVATVIPADLQAADGAAKLFRAAQGTGRRIELLINNAGLGIFGSFFEQTPAELEAMIQIDVAALTQLTRLFAEQMAAAGGGSILQVSSYAGLQPIPRYTVYSGAKAYVVAFSQALRHEMKPHHVRVCVLAPGFSATEFHDVSGHVKTSAMRFLSLGAGRLAEAGVRGVLRNQFLITPGWMYRVNNVLLRFLPRSLASAVSAAIVKHRTKDKQPSLSSKAA